LIEWIDSIDRKVQCASGDMLQQGAVGVGEFLLRNLVNRKPWSRAVPN
jgi:hypothetical protein